MAHALSETVTQGLGDVVFGDKPGNARIGSVGQGEA